MRSVPLEAYSGQFEIDVTAPRVVSSSVAEGDVIVPGALTVMIGFDEPMNDSVIGTNDFWLVGDVTGTKSVTSFTYDPATWTLMLYYTAVPQDAYTLTLISGDGYFEDTLGNDLDGEPVWPLPSGDGVAGGDFFVNFLIDPAAAVISGQIYNDLNGDGFHDTGEFGVNGWDVELVDTDMGLVVATTTTGGVDDNGDGVIDPQTEAGRYAFTGLLAGDYETRLAVPAGWSQTSPMSDPYARLFAVRGSGTVMTIYEYDPTDVSVLNSFLAPPTATAGLQGLAVGPDSLFYLDAGDMSVEPVLWELNLDTGAVIDSDSVPATIPAMAMGVAWLDGEVYIQLQTGEIAVFDPATDTVVRTLSVAGNAAGGLAASGDLGVLFACNSASQILTIDPATGAILDTFTLGIGSLFGGLAYRDGELLASNISLDVAGTVHRVNPVTGDVLGVLHLDGEGSTMGGLGGDAVAPPAPIWHEIALATGQLVTGADYAYHTSNIPGDMDGDGDVDADDIDLLFADFGDAGHAGPLSDLDGDGDADSGDMDILIHDLVETTIGVGTEYGDTNLDGMVDTTDATRLATHFSHSDVGWAGGDLNGSGLVNITDLVILATYFGFPLPPPSGGDSLSASGAATLGAAPATQSPQAQADIVPAVSEAVAETATPVTEPLSAVPTSSAAQPMYVSSPTGPLARMSEVVAPAAAEAAPAGPMREPDGQLSLRANVNDVRAKRGRRLGRPNPPAPTVMALAPSDVQTSKRRGEVAPARAQVAVGATVSARQSARRQRQDESFEDEFSVLDVDPLMKVSV